MTEKKHGGGMASRLALLAGLAVATGVLSGCASPVKPTTLQYMSMTPEERAQAEKRIWNYYEEIEDHDYEWEAEEEIRELRRNAREIDPDFDPYRSPPRPHPTFRGPFATSLGNGGGGGGGGGH